MHAASSEEGKIVMMRPKMRLVLLWSSSTPANQRYAGVAFALASIKDTPAILHVLVNDDIHAFCALQVDLCRNQQGRCHAAGRELSVSTRRSAVPGSRRGWVCV